MPAGADRVLQSVDVTMKPDATVSAVDLTNLSTVSGSSKTQTSTSSLTPSDATKDLPVRVEVAYHTDKKSGTNLADLKGYTGKVEIDLTVENLTVKSQQVTYDSNGVSHTQAALVGVPLTVAASTELKGVTPDDVVTTGDGALTNGVLSQSDKGNAVVQWATILAPPELGASTTMRLVVNATKFTPPEIDLSVQPGMVTDTSTANLIDSTFDPATSADMDLLTQTVELVGQLNDILADASTTVSAIRTNLDATSTTLGAKTASDLQESASSVTSAMKSLSGQTESLGQSISQRLATTQSSLLDVLNQTVNTVDTMLGDTSAPMPTTKVDGQGCSMVVAAPQQQTSLYGNLTEASAQLSAYAKASSGCKSEIQQSLTDMVGPATPDATSCQGSTSLTCSMYATENQFTAAATELDAEGRDAIAALQPQLMTDTMTSFGSVSASIDDVAAQVAVLQDAINAGGSTSFASLKSAVNSLDSNLKHLTSAVDDIHQQAIKARDAEQSITTESNDLATTICDMIDQGKISPADGETLRSYLVDTSCPASGATPLSPPTGYSAGIGDQLGTQVDSWNSIIAATDTSSDQGSIGSALATLNTDLTTIKNAVWDSSPTSLNSLIDTLTTTVSDLSSTRDDLSHKLDALNQQQSTLATDVQDAFDDAAKSTTDAATSIAQQQIDQITKQGLADVGSAGSLFDKSQAGLDGAATSITSNGTRVVNTQKAATAKVKTQAGADVTQQVQGDISQITQSVSASTKDLDGASTLLTQDLQQVILDLGSKSDGTGLLGSMSASAAKAGSADYQLAQATQTATAYGNLRGVDMDGIRLRQAQMDAGLKEQQQMPAFQTTLPSGAEHTIVYSLHIGGTK